MEPDFGIPSEFNLDDWLAEFEQQEGYAEMFYSLTYY